MLQGAISTEVSENRQNQVHGERGQEQETELTNWPDPIPDLPREYRKGMEVMAAGTLESVPDVRKKEEQVECVEFPKDRASFDALVAKQWAKVDALHEARNEIRRWVEHDALKKFKDSFMSPSELLKGGVFISLVLGGFTALVGTAFLPLSKAIILAMQCFGLSLAGFGVASACTAIRDLWSNARKDARYYVRNVMFRVRDSGLTDESMESSLVRKSLDALGEEEGRLTSWIVKLSDSFERSQDNPAERERERVQAEALYQDALTDIKKSLIVKRLPPLSKL